MKIVVGRLPCGPATGQPLAPTHSVVSFPTTRAKLDTLIVASDSSLRVMLSPLAEALPIIRALIVRITPKAPGAARPKRIMGISGGQP